MLIHGLFKPSPVTPKKTENNVFYVRWGGIPSWDPKSETLKKANTWGMGSGGFCLTSLHENKINEIVSFVAIEKHNGAVIKKLVDKWLASLDNKDSKEFANAMTEYQIKRLQYLAKGQEVPKFTPPESWSKALKTITDESVETISILIDKSSLVLDAKALKDMREEIVKFQIEKQRKNVDQKTIEWSPPEKWTSVMCEVALEANKAVDTMFSGMTKEGIIPLLYTESEYKQFYNEYCNKRLWPLFHRHTVSDPDKKDAPLKIKDIFGVAPCSTQAFKEYEHLSELTAKMIAQKAEPDGLVWLHDYHLFLVPEFLKEKLPQVKLGYHFHIPVPEGKLIEPLDADLKRLFTSVMQCNYLSFNTQRDLDNFKAIVTKMGLNTEGIIFQNNPIGTEPVKMLEKKPQAKIQATLDEIGKLREKHNADSKSEPPFFQVVLSVDRIEPSKGLKTRLKAIRDILESDALDADQLNILFVMVCPDSRAGISAYDELNKWFKEEVQRLNVLSNKKFGRDVIKLHGEMSQSELQTLGQQADTFMVTSDADGLHLGPVEWLATRNFHMKDKLANVIISTGAGVSEYFPHAMNFKPGDHAHLTSLLTQTTTEQTSEKNERSDGIKADFQGGQAKGFSLKTWRDNAAKGLAADVEKVEQASSRTSSPS